MTEKTKSSTTNPEAVHDLNFYKFIIDSLPVGVLTVDSGLRITSCNPSAEEILGYAKSEVIGRYCGEILKGQMCLSDCPLKTILESRSPVVRVETTIENSRGKRIPARMHTAGLFDNAGKLVGGLEAFVDISQLKALEREKHNFISMLAHDMKIPLISIDGFAFRLLKKVAKDESITRYVNIIRKEAKKLESLIDDFLEFARLQTGNLRLSFSATSMDRELRQLVEIYEPRASEKGINLKLDVDEVFTIIGADTNRLHRALGNLMDNAIKYSKENDTISISSKSTDKEIMVKIKDQGIGIEPKDLQNIFVPFHRGSGVDASKGFGIGLASVKTIVEGHGGRVLVESEVSKGSVFTVILPKKRNREGQSHPQG